MWPLGVWALSVVAASLRFVDGSWLAPLNELGQPCRFPLDPLLLPRGLGIGSYRCPYCWARVRAGVPHPDARDGGSGCEADGERALVGLDGRWGLQD